MYIRIAKVITTKAKVAKEGTTRSSRLTVLLGSGRTPGGGAAAKTIPVSLSNDITAHREKKGGFSFLSLQDFGQLFANMATFRGGKLLVDRIDKTHISDLDVYMCNHRTMCTWENRDCRFRVSISGKKSSAEIQSFVLSFLCFFSFSFWASTSPKTTYMGEKVGIQDDQE